MNQFSIVGNLTSDPELVTFDANTKVNFSFAYNDPFVKDKEKSVSYFDGELWGKAAESFAKWHKKGDKICVFGRLSQERWADKESGKNRSAVKLKCQGYTNVKPRTDGDAAGSPDIEDEDVPF